MPERGFLIFEFFCYFFGIFFPRSSMNGIRDYNFFLFFSSYLIPFWLKIMPERGFLIFEFFCYFFRNFLARVESERNSGLKFYSLFLGLSHPGLDRNNGGMMFFNCLNFFTIFFGIFLLGSGRTEFRTKIFFIFLGLAIFFFLELFELFFTLTPPITLQFGQK